MKYKKINMGSYNLHLIKTDKFKTTTVSVNFADRLKKDEITIRKFLFQMLCLSTKKYNTERLLSIKLEDLYAMNLGFANIAFGSLVNSYIDINFLDSEFSDDKLLDEALDFLFEILLNPNVKDNKFDKYCSNPTHFSFEIQLFVFSLFIPPPILMFPILTTLYVSPFSDSIISFESQP